MKQKGYTILEVLVAVIILAIVLPGLATLVISSRHTQTRSLRFENAASVGQFLYDSLQILPAKSVPENGSMSRIIDEQEYRVNWKKTAMTTPTGIITGGSKISLNVSWTVGGKSFSSTLTGALR